MYLSTFTRLDITASVAILSRRLQKPNQIDWLEAKQILRYLKGTINYKLKLGNLDQKENKLLEYADPDWAQNRIESRIADMVFNLMEDLLAGVVRSNLTWRFRLLKQNV